MQRALKILLWTVGSVVALVVLAIAAIYLFFPLDKAKAMAIEKGSAALGRPIAIEKVGLSLWGGIGVRLDNVSVGNPAGITGDPVLSTRNVDVKLRFWPLLSRKIEIDRFIVNSPNVNMVKFADGQNNFTFGAVDSTLPSNDLKDLPAEGKTAAAAVSFGKLEISGGTVLYRNDSTNVTVKLENLQLSTSLENPRPGVYQSSGNLKIDSVRVQSSQPIPVFAAGLSYTAAYDLNQKHLTFERADFDVNHVKLDLSGDFFHETGHQKLRARLKAEEISVEDLLTLIPPQRAQAIEKFRLAGQFAVDLDVDYDAARAGNALNYTGSAVITNWTLNRKDAVGELNELKLKRVVLDIKKDNLRVNIQEASFDGKPLKGSIALTNFTDPDINGSLSGYLNFVFLRSFLPAAGRHELDGEARFDVKFNGRVKDPKNIDFSGDVEITKGRYNAAFLPEPIESFEFDAYFDKQVVSVRKLTGRSKSAELSFTGRVDNLIPYLLADSITAKDIHPGVDGTLSGNADFALAKPFLPAKRKPELTGKIEFNLTVAGSTANLENIRPRGKVTISNATYTDSLMPEPIKRFDAELTLAPDTIAVTRMNVKFVSSDASFAGTLTKPFPYLLPLKSVDRTKAARPFFQFKLASNRFDVDKLFPEAVPGSGSDITKKPADSLPGLFIPDIDGQGTFDLDTLVYSKVEFSKIHGKVKIADRKIDVYEANGKAYTGDVSGKTVIDLSDFSNPQYTGEFKGNQIEADDFVSRFTPMGGHLFGKFDLSGTYSARGWDKNAFLQSISVDGLGSIIEGKLKTTGVVYSTLKSLADKVGKSFSEEQALKNLRTNVKVRDGKLIVDGFKTTITEIGDVDLAGSYGLTDPGAISFTGSVTPTKELLQSLASKGGVAGMVAGLLGNTKIKLPIAIGGTVTNPQLNLDLGASTSSATEGVKQGVQNQLQNQLNKLLPKKK
jgi:hypothetical protein